MRNDRRKTANMANLTLPAHLKCYLPEFSVMFQQRYLRTTHLVTAPLNIICVLVSTILNVLVLVAVYRTSRLRTDSILLLCSINAKDLCLVSVLQPLAVYRSFVFIMTGDFCVKTPVDTIRLYLIFLYRSVALTSLVLISVDRWLAIWKPTLYRSAFTMRRVLVAVAVVWLLSMAVSFVATYVIQPKHRYQLVFVQFGITAVVVLALQLHVFFGMKKHGQRLAHLNTTRRQRAQMAVDRTVSITVLYVTLALAVCYSPILVVSALHFVRDRSYLLLTSPWMELFLYANAVANPVIWINTNKHARSAVMEILPTCCRRDSAADADESQSTGCNGAYVLNAATNV